MGGEAGERPAIADVVDHGGDVVDATAEASHRRAQLDRQRHRGLAEMLEVAWRRDHRDDAMAGADRQVELGRLGGAAHRHEHVDAAGCKRDEIGELVRRSDGDVTPGAEHLVGDLGEPAAAEAVAVALDDGKQLPLEVVDGRCQALFPRRRVDGEAQRHCGARWRRRRQPRPAKLGSNGASWRSRSTPRHTPML